VIERLGGRLLVERLRLQWGPGGVVTPDRHRLTFRPPKDRGELLDLLTGALENTLDAHGRADLRTMPARDVATAQLDGEFPRYSSPQEWWAVRCLQDGEPIGFVIPTRNDYSWIIAYIGVLPRRRGHRYVDELLDHGTRTSREREPTSSKHLPTSATLPWPRRSTAVAIPLSAKRSTTSSTQPDRDK
jgi:hypothetical protein